MGRTVYDDDLETIEAGWDHFVRLLHDGRVDEPTRVYWLGYFRGMQHMSNTSARGIARRLCELLGEDF